MKTISEALPLRNAIFTRFDLASRIEDVESARNELGITVSYWKDLESIKKWKNQSDHLIAQNKGKNRWYKHYKARIAKVERDYEFKKE